MAPRRDGDSAVWFAFGVVLVGAIIALAASGFGIASPQWLTPPPSSHIAAGLIGAGVGYAELVLRYRDEPWAVARSLAGLAFVVINALAASVALFLLDTYGNDLSAHKDRISRVLLAGFGAMVVLRSRLLTLRQPGGADVAVGPAYLVDAFLAAVNRDIDRLRATQRISLVTAMARQFRTVTFAAAHPHLTASLLAFQALDAADREQVTTTLQALFVGAQRDLSDEIKFTLIGYDILNVFGERGFECVFAELRVSLGLPPVPSRG